MTFIQLPDITIQTLLKAFVVHGIMFMVFIIVAFTILKRSKKWLNIIISGFFIFMSLGLFCNFIFVLLSQEPFEDIVLILYYFTMFFLLMGPFFLTLFCFNLARSFTLNKRNQILVIVFYGVLLGGMYLIPGAIKIGPSTNWNPVYSLPYYLYIMTLLSIFSVIPQIYSSIKIYKRMKSTNLKRRFISFMIGAILIYIVAYGTFTYNFLDLYLVRLIFGYVSLICTILGGIFIYYGIAKI